MRIPRWPLSRTIVAAAAILLLPNPRPAFSLQNFPAKPAATATAPTDTELIDIRQQLIALLRVSPTLTQVLETDPSLLADQEYISRTNPQLAQFLTQHPEVTRNPDFYLFANIPEQRGKHVEGLHRHVNGNQPPNPEMEERRNTLNTIFEFLVCVGIGGSLLWLIRLLLQSRRWTRVFRLQSEVHSKLLDRFTHNDELLQYMNTESGKRFLEAAPIPIELEQGQRLPGGFGRVLGSLQIGIVLTLLGIGLLILQHSLPDFAAPLLVFGMVAMMPGIGFIISALITWRMSVRLGLMPNSPQPSTEPTDRQ